MEYKIGSQIIVLLSKTYVHIFFLPMQGAVEMLLDRSSFVQLSDGSIVELDRSLREVILKSLHEMSSSALRVLGFAYKDDLPHFATYNGDEDHPAHELLLNPANYSSIESKLVFVGLAGLRVSWFLIYSLTSFLFSPLHPHTGMIF